ncbi:MAG: hypothetical protein LBK62_07365 [Treponema sp.]|jgi:hypothetical protein|nr:hypothetical protein [Treponema sp.]
MKKQTKTQQIRNNPVINKGVKAAAVLAFAPLALTGCPTTIEYRDVPGPEVLVPTYPEITIPVRVWTSTMYLKCPGDLMNASASKINDVILSIETALNGDSAKSEITNLLSNNDVSIIVKNDGSVENCQKTGSFAMTINYQWLLASSNEDIGDTIVPVFGEMISGMAKAKDVRFDYEQNTVYITLAKAVKENQA